MRKYILIVAFGSAQRRALDALNNFKNLIEMNEGAVDSAAFVSLAFTSQRLSNLMKVEHVETALTRLSRRNIDCLHILPLFMMNGKEYEKIVALAQEYETCFEKIEMGVPILENTTLMDELVNMIVIDAPALRSDTRILYMGHGSNHTDTDVYHRLEQAIHDRGRTDIFIRTLEGTRTGFTDFLTKMKSEGIDEIRLKLLMLISGTHAIKDLSFGENSWEKMLEKESFTVETDVTGLLENEKFCQLLLSLTRLCHPPEPPLLR